MKILIVAAHPDDEVLGCFGTVAKLIQQGYEAYTLILSHGKTSRNEGTKEQLLLSQEMIQANTIIGIQEVFTFNFPDNSFDSIPLLEIVKAVDSIKNQIRPDIIFTHYAHDLNIDHQLTYKAVLTATRPMEHESVQKIYSFEILSSTEWNYPLSFSPDTFVDISDTLQLKQKAMECYTSELRKFPHPRSIEGIELNAKYHGMRVGKAYIEAFQTIRNIKDFT